MIDWPGSDPDSDAIGQHGRGKQPDGIRRMPSPREPSGFNRQECREDEQRDHKASTMPRLAVETGLLDDHRHDLRPRALFRRLHRCLDLRALLRRECRPITNRHWPLLPRNHLHRQRSHRTPRRILRSRRNPTHHSVC